MGNQQTTNMRQTPRLPARVTRTGRTDVTLTALLQ